MLLPHNCLVWRFLITVQDALKVSKWKEAVFEKMKTLEKNGTWEFVDLPKRKMAVGCK